MLEEIRLQNFKVFREQTIVLRPLTLLGGINGMGKSSVMQSLLLLRQSHQQNLLPDIGLALNGDYTEIGRGMDLLFEDAKTDDIQIGITIDQLASNWKFVYDNAKDTLELKDSVNPEVYQMPLFSKEFQYLSAERFGPRNLYPISDYIVRERRQLGIHGEYTAYFLGLFGSERVELKPLYHAKTKSHPTLRALTNDWLSEISPGIRFEVTNIPDAEMVRMTFSFDRGELPSKQFRATNVGFGISFTLPILVALLSSRPNALVLIENPEAHLHPRGQSKMGELIAQAAAAGIQVIVETHSDHVLNGIRIAVKNGVLKPDQVALHFFQRPEDDDGSQGVEVVTPELDEDGRIDFWPDGFFDEYGKALRNLL